MQQPVINHFSIWWWSSFSAPRPPSLHQDPLSCLEVQPQNEGKITGIVLLLKLSGIVSSLSGSVFHSLVTILFLLVYYIKSSSLTSLASCIRLVWMFFSKLVMLGSVASMQERVSSDDSSMKVTFVQLNSEPESARSCLSSSAAKRGFWPAFLSVLRAVLSHSFLTLTPTLKVKLN